MAEKKVEFDVIANDKASRKVDDVGDAFERAGKKADDSGGRFAHFASKVSDAGRTLATTGGKVAAMASLVGPLTSGLLGAGKAFAAVGQSVASLAPLIAFAPSLIGGWKFLKVTLAGIGKQMGVELKPLAAAFKAAQVEAGKLASDGVGEIGREFQKANFPAIREAMNRIGESVNRSTQLFGRWVNGAQGTKLIRDTVLGVSEAFETALPSIVAAGISLGNLANRANVRFQLQMLGEDIATLADKFNGWLDGISSQDITQALSNLGDAFGKVRDTFVFLRDVGRWMGENEGKVKAFSNALAILGITLGLFTGNPLAVVVGSLTLLINNWAAVKTAFGDNSWWSQAWSAISNDPNLLSIKRTLGEISTAIRGDLQGAWEMLKPQLQMVADKARELWTAIGPVVAQFFKDPNTVAGIRAIALALAALVVGFAALAVGAAVAVAAITAGMVGFVAHFTGTVVRQILGAIATLITGFGAWLVSMGRMVSAIPGLGSVGAAMQKAGGDALTAAGKVRQLSDQIGQLKSKTVTVTVNNVINTIRYESNGNVRISDGNSTQVARAGGGRIPGVPSRFDSVDALLAPGEFVVNSRQTSRHLPLLNSINDGGPLPAFGGGSSMQPLVINVTVSAGAIGSEDYLARQVSEAVEKSIRQGRGSLALAGGRG